MWDNNDITYRRSCIPLSGDKAIRFARFKSRRLGTLNSSRRATILDENRIAALDCKARKNPIVCHDGSPCQRTAYRPRSNAAQEHVQGHGALTGRRTKWASRQSRLWLDKNRARSKSSADGENPHGKRLANAVRRPAWPWERAFRCHWFAAGKTRKSFQPAGHWAGDAPKKLSATSRRFKRQKPSENRARKLGPPAPSSRKKNPLKG